MITGADPDGLPTPALLRAARGSYGLAVRNRLVAAGFDDMPRNGPYVLGGIVNTDRGRAAAAAVLSAVEAIDAELAELISPAGVAGSARHHHRDPPRWWPTASSTHSTRWVTTTSSPA